jgi:beta-lactamase class A
VTAEDRVRAVFADVGVRGWLHAASVQGEVRDVAVDADSPVVMASVYKVLLLATFAHAVDEGLLDPARPLSLEPSSRTLGETGVSAMSDPVTMSLRDLARSMITVSDNAAGDALLDLLGLDAVDATVRRLGLANTHVRGGTRDVHRLLLSDTGVGDIADAVSRMFDNDHPALTRVLDPHLASSTTPRDMTRLLSAIWSDTAASPEQCRYMRAVLAQQIWPHRLSSGFAQPGVRVAGKTGSLGPLRHEVGVIEYPHEGPVAVAVFTSAARADRQLPRVDAAIGTTARIAVDQLRWS